MQLAADTDQKLKKAIGKTEAPVMCCVENGSVSIAGYRRTIVACKSIKEAIIALLSTYYVFAVEYDGKYRLLMNFIQFALTGKLSVHSKKAIKLIKQLKLD